MAIGNNQFTNPYTEEQLEFLSSFRDSGLSYVEIAKLFNECFGTDKQKGSICDVCVRRLGFVKRVKTPHKLNEEELAFLEKNYLGRSRAELTRMFNEHFGTSLTEGAIKQACNLRGWKNGLTGKFGTREDWKPWNIGISKEEFYSHYDKGAVYKNTRGMVNGNILYHKGDIVYWHGQKHIVIADASGFDLSKKKYSWKDRVIPLGRYVWEQANGPIPSGYKIIYKDGNVNNCELDNLLCVNNATIMYLAANDGFRSGEVTETMVDISTACQAIKKVREL